MPGKADLAGVDRICGLLDTTCPRHCQRSGHETPAMGPSTPAAVDPPGALSIRRFPGPAATAAPYTAPHDSRPLPAPLA